MKAARLIPCLLIAAALLPSCDKARELIAEAAKKAGKTGTAHSEWVSEIGADDFETFSQQGDKVVIIDFHAPWCGPCRELAPILDEIANEHGGKVVVGKINVDDHPGIATDEGVQGIPDVRIFRGGVQVDKIVGLPPASELKQRIDSHVAALPAASGEAAGATEAAAEKEPAVRPMTEDWLPPGIQKR
ncbi:MAG TPA: thioredoxin [Luteolibacter sp.]|nr:thioredoxin [Luteolibacter sp.]